MTNLASQNNQQHQMPRDIPGFYYDQNRGKYFRIQANHNVPRPASRPASRPTSRGASSTSAPASRRQQEPGIPRQSYFHGTPAQFQYTEQAIRTARRHESERAAKQPRLDRQERECLRRSAWFSNPMHSLDLDIRLGGTLKATRTGRTVRSRCGVGEGVRRQYASLLESDVLFDRGKPGPKFSIASGSARKELFMVSSVDGRWDGRELCVTPLSCQTKRERRKKMKEREDDSGSRASGPFEMREHDDDYDDSDGEEPVPTYDPSHTTPILNTGEASALLPLSESLLLWSVLRPQAAGQQDASPLCISKRYPSDSVPWQNWRDEFGEWGTQIHTFQSVIWDMAKPQSWHDTMGAGGKVVLATSNGVKAMDVLNAGVDGMKRLSLRKGGSRRRGESGDSEEYMCASFKEEHVVMVGDRSGSVILSDLRVNGGVMRISHGSGVSAVRRMRNDNLVLVNGLKGISAYDLRYPTTSKKTGVGKRHGVAEHLSLEAIKFDVPFSMQQKRYGLAFDYDEEMNLMVASSTDFLSWNRIGMWDCGTGQQLEGGALARREFDDAVTQLQWVDLRGQGGYGKSIVSMCGGVVEEWHV